MVKDYFIRMALSGVIATIITTICNYICFKFHLIDHDILTYVASVLLPNSEPLNKISSKAVGLIGHIFMGAGFGVFTGWILLVTGTSFPYIKGIGVGAFYWLIFHRALTANFWVIPAANLTARSVLYEIPEHFLNGLLTVWLSFMLSY